MNRLTGLTLLFLLLFSSISLADMEQHIQTLMKLASNNQNQAFLDTVDKQKLINKTDKNGQTPLFAALFGSETLIEQVINRGENVNHKDINGMSPLIVASMLGHVKAVRLLINKGANINATMNDGNPALKVAVVSSSASDLPTPNSYHHHFKATINQLIKSGADVNAVDNFGAPILLYPIFNKQYWLCELLLEAKARPNVIYKDANLLKIARHFSTPEIVSLLKKHGAK